ncbi:MAG: hypothetical protein KatS3mg008_1176 [Acidimicrobiales bacterium]|nr:MAG: hypothetical protein KatS3mg008_1176 [Acidimicrobiales bacterium]
MNMSIPLILANTQRNVAYVITALVILGYITYVVFNWLQARRESGSELELAANRKTPPDDEELEGPRLDRVLGVGLGTLALISLALPLYWLGEPSRQAGAEKNFRRTFIERGRALYEEGAQCVNCHGPEGKGGVASYALLDDRGKFVAQVNWKAPALDTVLMRYSREEVRYILNYGRRNTPMPAWGAPGGGPLTPQQIENIIDYLESIQLPAEEVRRMVKEQIDAKCAPDENDRCTKGRYKTLGEFLFNLGEDDGFQGGAFSCARCHTKGWSYGKPETPGGGFLGPNLTGGATLRQFESFEAHMEFITQGAEQGKPYGRGGMSGAGQMPGFGYNPNAEQEGSTLEPEQYMYTADQIEAIVEYERGL